MELEQYLREEFLALRLTGKCPARVFFDVYVVRANGGAKLLSAAATVGGVPAMAVPPSDGQGERFTFSIPVKSWEVDEGGCLELGDPVAFSASDVLECLPSQQQVFQLGQTHFIALHYVELKAGPSAENETKLVVPLGSEVIEFDRKGEWVYVAIRGGDYHGKSGWVESSDLRPAGEG